MRLIASPWPAIGIEQVSSCLEWFREWLQFIGGYFWEDPRGSKRRCHIDDGITQHYTALHTASAGWLPKWSNRFKGCHMLLIAQRCASSRQPGQTRAFHWYPCVFDTHEWIVREREHSPTMRRIDRIFSFNLRRRRSSVQLKRKHRS